MKRSSLFLTTLLSTLLLVVPIQAKAFFGFFDG